MSVAIHEAGHAVVARWAGLRPGVARIDAIGGGECYYDEPRRRRKDTIEYLRKSLTVAVAGMAAEQIANGVDPLNAAVSPAEIAWRILSQERAPQAEKRPEGGALRYPDQRRWAVDELAGWLKNETLAFKIVDEVLAADALRRAVRVLCDRWAEVEHLAERLDIEREITI